MSREQSPLTPPGQEKVVSSSARSQAPNETGGSSGVVVGGGKAVANGSLHLQYLACSNHQNHCCRFLIAFHNEYYFVYLPTIVTPITLLKFYSTVFNCAFKIMGCCCRCFK